MTWQKFVDPLFPVIEPMIAVEIQKEEDSLTSDIEGIEAANFDVNDERALDEAQRVAAAEIERVRTSESKATTYLAVLAALVPLVITLQAATWEDKTGPAPEALKIAVLAIATVYVAAAGYHAFKTLQVSGIQKIGESEIVSAWELPNPIRRLARNTLLASRRSRKDVNAKVTRIKVTHQHLIRAFGAFVLLLMLDPLFYGLGFRNEQDARAPSSAAGDENEVARADKIEPEIEAIKEETMPLDGSGKELKGNVAKEEMPPGVASE